MDVFLVPATLGFGVPLAVVFGSLLLGSILRISPIFSVLGALIPIALPHMDLPFVHELARGHPEYLVIGGWIALLVSALGWAAFRPVVVGSAGHVSFTRLFYRSVLFAALLVVALLVFNPGMLAAYAPEWRGTMGGVLLTAALVCMSTAFARMLKAGFVLAVWAVVTSVLASELLWQKLPHTVTRGDLGRLPEILTSGSGRAVLSVFGRWAPMGAQTVGRAIGVPHIDTSAGNSSLGWMVEKAAGLVESPTSAEGVPPTDV
jgi:hypothetical protein